MVSCSYRKLPVNSRSTCGCMWHPRQNVPSTNDRRTSLVQRGRERESQKKRKKKVRTYLDFARNGPTRGSHFSKIFRNKLGDRPRNSRHCLFAVFAHNLCSSRRPRNRADGTTWPFSNILRLHITKRNRTDVQIGPRATI